MGLSGETMFFNKKQMFLSFINLLSTDDIRIQLGLRSSQTKSQALSKFLTPWGFS